MLVQWCVTLGANTSTGYLAHIDDLSVLKGQRELTLLRCFSVNNVFVITLDTLVQTTCFESVKICFFLACVINAFSSLQVEDNDVSSMIFIYLSLLFLLPVSEPTHKNRHRFHWRRPTVFLWHQKTDYGVGIYQISPRIWHLWVLFFTPILHRIRSSFRSPCVTPISSLLRKSLTFEGPHSIFPRWPVLCPEGDCRRNMHFYSYLTAHRLRQTPMCASILRPAKSQKQLQLCVQILSVLLEQDVCASAALWSDKTTGKMERGAVNELYIGWTCTFDFNNACWEKNKANKC